MLLERPGDIITREELQARLSFVGFDEGINTAIRKLRVAFGDSADNPRFIQTIPRCGYRFLAPVHEAAAERPLKLRRALPLATPPLRCRVRERETCSGWSWHCWPLLWSPFWRASPI
jgi:DNA-binding winged helix-turn-helix (wHTH) protein